jgi:hypothetical protein
MLPVTNLANFLEARLLPNSTTTTVRLLVRDNQPR